MIKVDWLDAGIALRVVGAVLVVFLRRWRKICTILQPTGSKDRYLKNPDPLSVVWIRGSGSVPKRYYGSRNTSLLNEAEKANQNADET